MPIATWESSMVLAKMLDGHACSEAMREGVNASVDTFTELAGRPPGLAVILASDDPASRLYVNMKRRACEEVGIRSMLYRHDPSEGSAGEYVRKVLTQSGYLDDTIVDGVLVQLPIPGVEDPKLLFDLIPVGKDVDAFHPENVGRLMQGRPRFRPCTPLGIMHLLSFHGIVVEGLEVCIINDSNIVGRPLAMMMTDAGATVTICHKRTDPHLLAEITATKDIVVVGVGIPNFLKADMVAPGSVVVDVGINRVDGVTVGDVHKDVWQKASWVTPVPGGVGPMTVTMLLYNTLRAACDREGLFRFTSEIVGLE